MNDSIITCIDSLSLCIGERNQCCSGMLETGMSAWDITFNICTIVCTIINVVLVYHIYKQGNKRDDEKTENQHRINMFQVLILNYNIQCLYDFYNELINTVNTLQTPELSEKQKIEINDKIVNEIGIAFRVKFVDCLNAISPSLYKEILEQLDSLTDDITVAIFDEGIKLSHKPKFDELITAKIFRTKTEMLRRIFEYDGKIKSNNKY